MAVRIGAQRDLGADISRSAGTVFDDDVVAQISVRRSPTTRATMSVELPGGKATMMRTGLAGNGAAGCAHAVRLAADKADISKYMMLLIIFMISPPEQLRSATVTRHPIRGARERESLQHAWLHEGAD